VNFNVIINPRLSRIERHGLKISGLKGNHRYTSQDISLESFNYNPKAMSDLSCAKFLIYDILSKSE